MITSEILSIPELATDESVNLLRTGLSKSIKVSASSGAVLPDIPRSKVPSLFLMFLPAMVGCRSSSPPRPVSIIVLTLLFTGSSPAAGEEQVKQ